MKTRYLSAAIILATLTACSPDAAPREAIKVTRVDAGASPNAEPRSKDLDAPKAPPLVFPSSKLKSAEVQSWRLGGEWKTLDLETASDLVSALSENHRYFKPDNLICVLFTPPKWLFRFNWPDGTSMLVPLGAEGSMTRGIELMRDGVKQDSDYGTYIVESKRVKEILKRCPTVEEFTRETCAVCGISVLSSTPFSKGWGARIFYFCAAEHLDQFEQSPEAFENGPKSSQGEDHR